jgi:hypothetical protein
MGLHRLGIVGIPVLCLLAALGATACSSTDGEAETVTTPTVPAALAVPEGHAVFLKAPATGSQIYTCTVSTEAPGTYGWTFKAPDAVLFGANGEKVGTHYAGPTWESNDTSKVVGAVKEKADATTPGSVPWLLLKTKSTEGTGTFGKVTYIQRLDTSGGTAPTTGCDAAHEGQENAVPYTANYYFYAAR